MKNLIKQKLSRKRRTNMDNKILHMIYDDLQEMKSDISELKTDVSELKTDVSELKTDVSELKMDMVEVKSDIKRVEKKFDAEINSIKLTLENEIRHNISIIAEGHLDLVRKLDEAIKVNQEKEVALVRLNNLENDVRLLKEKSFNIA